MRLAGFIAGAMLALAASAATAQDIETLERQLDKAREAAPLVRDLNSKKSVDISQDVVVK